MFLPFFILSSLFLSLFCFLFEEGENIKCSLKSSCKDHIMHWSRLLSDAACSGMSLSRGRRWQCRLGRLPWLMRDLSYLSRSIFLHWVFSTNTFSTSPSVFSASSLELIHHKSAFHPSSHTPTLNPHTHVYPTLPFLRPAKTPRFLFVSLKSTAGQ